LKHTSTLFTPSLVRFLIGLGFVSALCRLFPWRLDYNDLAKQAYASYDMVVNGAWWVQESPDGNLATKPPGVAWSSAGFYLLFRNWPLAWHLPSFLAAGGILLLLKKWLGTGAAAGAASLAFLYNHFSQNMVFVIRTDMVLAFFVFLAIGFIHSHISTERPWSGKESFLFSMVIVGGLFTKGPVILAFLVPGMLLFQVVYRKAPRYRRFLPPFWTWVLATAVFLAWVGAAALADERFYQQVVLTEFASRFQSGGVTRARPPGRYVLYFLQRFLPWSVFFLILLLTPRLRRTLWARPSDRWLLLCCAGSWVLLELLPSKRPDRMYPLIPVCAWLIGIAFARKDQLTTASVFRKPLLAGFLGVAVLGQTVYSVTTSLEDARNREGELVSFGRHANDLVQDTGNLLWIQREVAFQTGMVLYADSPHILDESEMIPRWRNGEISYLIVDSLGLDLFHEAGVTPEAVLISDNPDAKDERIHYLLQHGAAP